MSLIEPGQQCAVQLVRINRFGNEVIHPGLKAMHPIFVEGIGGHRQDWRRAIIWQRPDRPRRVQSPPTLLRMCRSRAKGGRRCDNPALHIAMVIRQRMSRYARAMDAADAAGDDAAVEH